MSAALRKEAGARARRPRHAAPRDPLVKSAARVLEILEFFDATQRPVGAQLVADTLGYPASSTQALLRSLVALGYLAFDPVRRCYAPTLRVALLGGGWIAPELCGTPPLRALINAIGRRSGGDVAVMVRNGDGVDAIMTQGPALSGRREGVLDGAGGRCLLAACEDGLVGRMLHRMNADAVARDRPRTEAATLMRDIGLVRRRGWIAQPDPRGGGRGHVAMLLASAGSPDLALVLSVSAAGLDERVAALAAMMREECEPWLRPNTPWLAPSDHWMRDRAFPAPSAVRKTA